MKGRALRLLLVVWILLGAHAASAERTRILAPLVVNGEEKGEILFYLDGDDFYVRIADLAGAGIAVDQLRGHVVHPGDSRTAGGGYVSLASLSPAVTHAFDVDQVVLRLEARPDLLGTRVLDLGSRRRPDSLQREQAPAMFLNYAVRGNELSSEDLRTFGLSTEAGASAGGIFAYSSGSTRPDGRFVRGLSRMSFDLPELLARLTAGDDFTTTTALGGGGFVGGLHFARRFELDPWLQRTPLPTLSGAAETPSTLEVYMDGVLVRREEIQPGTFELHNLPVMAGSGQASYVLRDAFGRETEVSGSYTVGASLLRQGLTDWTYTLGFRRNGLGLESADYGAPVFLGAHRLGLTDWLTAGLRLEGAEDLASGGAELAVGTPVGLFAVEGAGSTGAGRSGAAAVASWAYASRAIGLSLWAQTMGKGYANASLDPGRDRALFDGGVGLSVPVTDFAGASLRLSGRRLRDAGHENRQELHVNWRLLPRVSIITSGTRTDGASGPGWAAFASLSVMLPRSATAQTWGRVTEDDALVGVALQETARGETGLDYRAAVTQGVESADVRATWRGQHGQVRADFFSADKNSHLGAEVAGSLVAIGEKVFLSRPVNRSFALVRVPGVPGATVRLNNRAVGTTSEEGELFVTGLQSYDANRISLDIVDLPFDQSFDSLEAWVAPPQGGGALVVFEGRQIRSIRGRVLGPGGQPLGMGELVVWHDRSEERFLVGRRGQFEVDLPAGAYLAELHHGGGSCLVELHVPPVDAAFFDLGELRCREEL